MTTLAIRKKLHRYIDKAQDKNVKAIYSIVEEVLNKEEEVWTESFIEEQESRANEFETNKIKAKSWSAIKKGTRKKNSK
jgi:hypothetical protein